MYRSRPWKIRLSSSYPDPRSPILPLDRSVIVSGSPEPYTAPGQVSYCIVSGSPEPYTALGQVIYRIRIPGALYCPWTGQLSYPESPEPYTALG